MNYKHVLRYQPELRLSNRYNISDRMLKLTKGDLFIAYNVIKGVHEVHSVENFKINNISFNVALTDEMVNGFIYNDYKANNLKMFVNEVKDRREKTNHLYDKAEENSQSKLSSLEIVERTLGTKL
jgi:hypothetical protein